MTTDNRHIVRRVHDMSAPLAAAGPGLLDLERELICSVSIAPSSVPLVTHAESVRSVQKPFINLLLSSTAYTLFAVPA